MIFRHTRQLTFERSVVRSRMAPSCILHTFIPSFFLVQWVTYLRIVVAHVRFGVIFFGSRMRLIPQITRCVPVHLEHVRYLHRMHVYRRLHHWSHRSQSVTVG